MEIAYKINEPITPEDARTLFQQAGLNRPQELETLAEMLKHANVLITAWQGGRLVGLLRAMTDYRFDCYLNDLAVHPDVQGQGIARQLIELLKEQLHEKVMILLVAAKDAVGFYERIGFQNFPNVQTTWYTVTP